jgi:3-hexulose-6-phosphate synthase
MKLQIAIDIGDAQTALQMVNEIHDVIDIVEIGTPLIVREGLLAVRLIKASYPDVAVTADLKIVDGGGVESADAFAAGADLVTVLAVANNETIEAVAATARKFGKQVVADMICVPDVEKRALELDNMGLDYFCIHTAADVRNMPDNLKTPFDELTRVMRVLKNSKTAVAGGVNINTIPLVKKIGPEIVIVGSALTNSANLRAAVVEIQEALKK